MIGIGMDCQEYRSQVISTYFNDHWLVVWNINGLFVHLLGIPSSQLTFTPSFFREVGWNHQPDQTHRHWHRLSVGCRQANLSIMTGARFSGVIGERQSLGPNGTAFVAMPMIQLSLVVTTDFVLVFCAQVYCIILYLYSPTQKSMVFFFRTSSKFADVHQKHTDPCPTRKFLSLGQSFGSHDQN